MAACCPPLLGRRVSAGLLTRGGCGEGVDRALHPIAPPIGPHRRSLVIVGGVRFQRLRAPPKNCLRVATVEPDVIFRRLAQIVGIRAVVCDRPMIVIPARVGAGPSDDGEVVMGNFEPWPLSDLDVLGPLLRRRVLSTDWAGAEQAAGGGGDRQFHEQSIHRTNPNWLFPVLRREYGGRARPPYLFRALRGRLRPPERRDTP